MIYFQNRVEILWNTVTLSIQQAYNIFLKNLSDLNNYRAYRNVMLSGFKVRRKAIKTSTNDVVQEPECKKQKLSEKSDLEERSELMKLITDNAPKQIENDVIREPNYHLFLGENKRSEPNFNLYIR